MKISLSLSFFFFPFVFISFPFFCFTTYLLIKKKEWKHFIPDNVFVQAYLIIVVVWIGVTMVFSFTLYGIANGETASERQDNEEYRGKAKESNKVSVFCCFCFFFFFWTSSSTKKNYYYLLICVCFRNLSTHMTAGMLK